MRKSRISFGWKWSDFVCRVPHILMLPRRSCLESRYSCGAVNLLISAYQVAVSMYNSAVSLRRLIRSLSRSSPPQWPLPVSEPRGCSSSAGGSSSSGCRCQTPAAAATRAPCSSSSSSLTSGAVPAAAAPATTPLPIITLWLPVDTDRSLHRCIRLHRLRATLRRGEGRGQQVRGGPVIPFQRFEFLWSLSRILRFEVLTR